MVLSLSRLLLVSLSLVACGGDDDGGGGGTADGGGSRADASTRPDGGRASDAGRGRDAGDADAGNTADAAAIPEVGAAVIGGEVRGQSLAPLHAWYTQYPGGGPFAVAMPEDDVTCDLEAPFAMATASVGFPCGPAEAGTYPIVADPQAECKVGAPHAWMLVENLEDGTAELLAASGSVTVVSVDGTSVAGSFAADFGDGGALSGSFNASVCAN